MSGHGSVGDSPVGRMGCEVDEVMDLETAARVLGVHHQEGGAGAEAAQEVRRARPDRKLQLTKVTVG
jgi:hypothetical protein